MRSSFAVRSCSSNSIRSLFVLVAILSGLTIDIPAASGQDKKQSKDSLGLADAKEHIYRTVQGTELKLYRFVPPNHQESDARPAILFFFGGGWKSGTPKQFEQQCRYLASRGMVAMTADYRVESRQQVKAMECVRDAFAAMQWVRDNAQKLGIDPNRVAAGGGSAGGHLAACLATIRDQKLTEHPTKDPFANALVLFNPAVALAPFEGLKTPIRDRSEELKIRMGTDPRNLSPAHHVHRGMPPTIQFFGTDDDLLAGAQFMDQKMKEVGVRSELITYKDQKHGFFNFGRGENLYFKKTLNATDEFLVSLGWLQGPSQVDSFFSSKR